MTVASWPVAVSRPDQTPDLRARRSRRFGPGHDQQPGLVVDADADRLHSGAAGVGFPVRSNLAGMIRP